MRFALMLNADLSKRVVLINLEFIASAKVSREGGDCARELPGAPNGLEWL